MTNTEYQIGKVLETIGLNKNEISIYLNLMKFGKASAMDLSKRTNIHRSNVYDVVEELIKKGIVMQSIEEGRKTFYPVKPKDLLNYLKFKEAELIEIIPEMQKLCSETTEKKRIMLFEGIISARKELMNCLDLKKPIYVYGIPQNSIEFFGEGFLKSFHSERMKNKIQMNHIYNKNLTDRMKKINKLKHTEAKHLSSHYDANITTLICGNKVILFFWEEKPISGIIIEDFNIAKTYQNYFEILWKKANHQT